jgi:hypothetical protein
VSTDAVQATIKPALNSLKSPSRKGGIWVASALARDHAICGKAPRSAKSSKEVEHDLHVKPYMDLQRLKSSQASFAAAFARRPHLLFTRDGN